MWLIQRVEWATVFLGWGVTLALANTGPTTLGDAMTEAEVDIVDRNPSPQATSAETCLKHFTERVTKARQLPLLELPHEASG
jgi:hypothetical protein